MTFQRVFDIESLWPGEMTGVIVCSVRVLLINLNGTLHAYENRCAHKAVELSNGRLDGDILTCSAHEWQYDVNTGCGLNPCGIQLRRFPVKIEGPDILVDIDDDQP